MKRFPLVLGLALLLVCSVGAQQQQQQRQQRNRANDRNKDDVSNVIDQDFVQRVAMGNLAEVEIGRLALSQSRNAEVRKFAQRLINA